MNDTVANPAQGAASDDAAQPELSIEEQIANAIPDLGDEPEKKTPNKESSKEDSDEEGDEPQPTDEDSESDDSDDSEDSDDDEADEADSDGDEDSDEQQSDDEDGEEPQFKSLEELAEAAEMSVEDILAMYKGKIKVQGKEQEVTFDDLLKGQMLEADYRLKTSNLAEDKRTFEQDKAEATQVIRAQVAESVNVLNALTQEFTAEAKNTDWDELKRIDPTEYSLRRGEMTERADKLQSFKAKIQEQQNKLKAENEEKRKAEVTNYQLQQADNIKRLIPSWIDQNVADKESGEIRTWLKTAFDGDLNFTDSEIDNLSDARMVAIIRKAMDNDKKAQKADVIKKKVKGTRKILKSNAKQPKKSVKQIQKKKAQKAIKSGNIQDAEQAILGML